MALKLIVNKGLRYLRKVNTLNSKIQYGKQNPVENNRNKYKKHVACSLGYKLVYVDDKFSKPFRS